MLRWRRRRGVRLRAAAGRCAAVLAALLASGCASIVGGQMQVVSVETPGCPGARCELINDKGRFHVESTPGTVTLNRSYNNLQVSCSRDGAAAHNGSAAPAARTAGAQSKFGRSNSCRSSNCGPQDVPRLL